MQMKVEINFYDQIPKWYGISYKRWEKPVVVCHHIPLNFIVGWFMFLKWKIERMKVWCPCFLFDEEQTAVYKKGWDDAVKSFKGET